MSAIKCVNLQTQFGDRYRVAFEESYCADHGATARADDPWLQIILCQHGHIYPHGAQMLGASTTKRGSVAKRILVLPSTEPAQESSDVVLRRLRCFKIA
jgi:hypothetical protein